MCVWQGVQVTQKVPHLPLPRHMQHHVASIYCRIVTLRECVDNAHAKEEGQILPVLVPSRPWNMQLCYASASTAYVQRRARCRRTKAIPAQMT